MSTPKEKSKEWANDTNYPVRVLYDDGEYTVIWGKYFDTPALGTRWNHSDEGKKPQWHIEPDFIASAILQRLLTFAIDSQNYGYYDNILFAISELNKQVAPIDNPEDYK